MNWYIGAFEKTGLMAQPWVDAGYNAVCIDIDANEGNRNGVEFVKADMQDWIPDRKIVEDGIIFFAAFPPCDHLAVSGARWFAGKGLGALAGSIELFERATFWANWFGAPYLIENPVSTISTYWRKPDYSFHPWQYCGLCPDDEYTKKTCLWTGNGFVMPQPDHPDHVNPDDRIHKAAPSPERSDIRSATPKGFAKAVYSANAPITENNAWTA
jgi:hypothetical protein